jgi:hypothetical protein
MIVSDNGTGTAPAEGKQQGLGIWASFGGPVAALATIQVSQFGFGKLIDRNVHHIGAMPMSDTRYRR